MPRGQPTKYNKGILEKANEYLENYENYDDVIPSVIGLGLMLGESRQTLYNWKAAQPDFFVILEKIIDKQHQVLISKGLSGAFNSNITKLVLGKHGYHEKQDTTVKLDLSGKSYDELVRLHNQTKTQVEQSTQD